jgi:hypothetical protein
MLSSAYFITQSNEMCMRASSITGNVFAKTSESLKYILFKSVAILIICLY